MLTHNVFKEAEQSRFFWQSKLSLEVKQVLEMSAETTHGLKSVQRQVQRLEEVLQKHITSNEGVSPLPPETQHPRPGTAPWDHDSADSDGQKKAMQEMLRDTMRRSSTTIADRLDELHERLDQVHLSHAQRLDEVLQDTASSREQFDRLATLLSSRQEEAILISHQEVPAQPSKESLAQQSSSEAMFEGRAPLALQSRDPLVEFGKVSSQGSRLPNQNTSTTLESQASLGERRGGRKSSFEAIGTVINLQLSRELNGVDDDEIEPNDFDALDVREDSIDRLLRYINRVSFVVVLINTVFMGVTLDISIHYWHRGETPPHWIRVIEIGFTIIYCIEMTLRVVLEKKQFCMGRSAAWNFFDLFVVLFAVFESLHSIRSTSLLRICRILRLLKTARALRSLQSLRVCRVVLKPEVMAPLLWTCGMLVGFLFVSALVFTTCVGDFTSTATVQQESEKLQLLEMYGSVYKTMKTIFSAVTGGEPWRELSRPLGVISEFVQFCFWLVIFIVIFGLMNTVTAVYCDNLIYHSNIDRLSFDRRRDDKLQLKNLRSLLTQETVEDDGKIKRQQLMRVLKGSGASILKQLGLELWVAQALFRLLDAEDEGAVVIDEYVYGLLNLKGNAQNIHMSSLEHQSKRIVTKVQGMANLLEQTVVPQLALLSADGGGADGGGIRMQADSRESTDATQQSSGHDCKDSVRSPEPKTTLSGLF